jgi:hypothetical protein
MNHLSTKFYLLFSLAIILFFGINYTSNNPQVLGDRAPCQDASGTYINCGPCNPLIEICGSDNGPHSPPPPTITPTPIPTPTPTLMPDSKFFIPQREKGICHWNNESNLWNVDNLSLTNNDHQDHKKDYPYIGPYDIRFPEEITPANQWCQDHVPNADGSWCYGLSDGSCQDAAGTYQSSHPNIFLGKSINYDCVGTPLEDNTYSNVKCQSREECTPWLFLPGGYCNWPIITFFTGK